MWLGDLFICRAVWILDHHLPGFLLLVVVSDPAGDDALSLRLCTINLRQKLEIKLPASRRTKTPQGNMGSTEIGIRSIDRLFMDLGSLVNAEVNRFLAIWP